MREFFTRGPRAVRFGRLLSTVIVVVVALICVGAAAPSGGDTTYSATQTIAVPPASNFAGSGGGDGWGIALSSDKVFQVFHHTTLTLACHSQSDAAACYTPKQIRETSGSLSVFTTSYKPGMYLDQASGKLYVYAERNSDASAGVVCIDTTQVSSSNPFCGYAVLTSGAAVDNYLDISAPVTIGTRFYAFNYNSGTAGNGKSQLLCFDVASGAACAGQPFSVLSGATYASLGEAMTPIAMGTDVVVPVNASGYKLACFDTSSNGACGGAWPVAIGSGQNVPVPRLDASGAVAGVCLPGTATCWTLAGAPVAAPSGFAGVIPQDGYWFLGGPAVVIGSRIYFPRTIENQVACYDWSTSAGCAGFPKPLASLSLAYTVNADPQRPTCLWVNADGGSAQIQNFDAFTGGACGSGATRVLTSSFVVGQAKCYPTSYKTLRVDTPAPGSYTSGTVQFADAGGNPIPGVSPVVLDANGVADLSGLNLTAANGLPQYLITLAGASTAQLTVTLTWGANYDPACTPTGGTVEKKATTTAASLAGGSTLRVDPGVSATASAALTGGNAAAASGTVTYTWYSDATCTTAASTGSPRTIATPGTLPDSAPVTLPIGTYYVVASYGGDDGNETSQSGCGDAVLTVRNPDTTPPVTTATAPSGWQNTAAAVTLSATDDLSGVASTYYVVDGGTTQTGASLSIGDEGSHTVTYWSVDNAGNVEAAHTLTVQIDKTDPFITATRSVDPNAAGWNNVNVTVTFGCTDALSGIASCPSATTFGEGADQSVTGTATDNAGNSASASVTHVNVDKTKPTVVFTPTGRIYDVDETVAITCTANDVLSGVASTTCSDVNAQGWSLGLGQHTLTATATDKAGNTGSGSGRYTVTATARGVCALVQEWSSKTGVADSLCAKLTAAAGSRARGQDNAADNQLAAFRNELAAQSGKSFSAAHADTLAALSRSL